jgi:hypothetical protein
MARRETMKYSAIGLRPNPRDEHAGSSSCVTIRTKHGFAIRGLRTKVNK